MKAIDALAEFRSFMTSRSKRIDLLSPHEATQLMTEFYTMVRADNCDLESDGDMLLFQWGTYDWGNGTYFEYDITRQFIFPMTFKEDGEEWEEDTIWQLSLTLKFPPAKRFVDLKGNEWCHTPKQVSTFRDFIESHASTHRISNEKPTVVELDFERQ